MSEAWSVTQVLALSPDASSTAAARRLAGAAGWTLTGACTDQDGAPAAVWGLCSGSGKSPYQTVVDLTGPAYRCSCPSRKFPCKHALALLLRWSSGSVPDAAEPAGFAAEWLTERAERAERTTRAARTGRDADNDGGNAPEAAEAAAKRARVRLEQRTERVVAGLEELDRWLRDGVRSGLAGLERAGYQHFDHAAARMVDAQAPGVAATLRALPTVIASGPDWPERLLTQYARLRLLVVAHRRLTDPTGGLADDLARTVRSRIGYPVGRDEVLAGPAVRDRWLVVGLRDSEEDRLATRRVWLRGRGTGRPALILSFAPPGQALDASLIPGTEIDVDLHFYPGRSAVRALVGSTHGRQNTVVAPPDGGPVAAAYAEYAAALAADPWLTGWPVSLRAVTPVAADQSWYLRDDTGAAVPIIATDAQRWTLLAASGGHPVTVLAELTQTGAVPLSVYADDGEEGLVIL